jgi:hypothetical protein
LSGGAGAGACGRRVGMGAPSHQGKSSQYSVRFSSLRKLACTSMVAINVVLSSRS